MTMKVVQVRLSDRDIKEINRFVRKGFYSSKSDFLRDSIRKNLELLSIKEFVENASHKKKKSEFDEIRMFLSEKIRQFKELMNELGL